MLVCVSTCGHADMCWYVPTCAGKCQLVKPLLAPLIPTIWTLPCMLARVSTFGLNILFMQGAVYINYDTPLVTAHLDMPTCTDMCRHVTLNLDTFDSGHLDLIWILGCVSICGHADMCWYVLTCAGMYQHVKPLSAPLIPTIWTLPCMLARVSTFGHADMCWYVPT